MIPLWSAAARRRFSGRHRATQPYSCSSTSPRHSDRNDPTSAICHPERSGPTFPLAPPSGASGRVVEGSWHDFDLFAIHGTIPPNAPGAPGTECVPGSWVSPVAQSLLTVLLGSSALSAVKPHPRYLRVPHPSRFSAKGGLFRSNARNPLLSTLTLLNSSTLSPLPSSPQSTVAFPLFRSPN